MENDYVVQVRDRDMGISGNIVTTKLVRILIQAVRDGFDMVIVDEGHIRLYKAEPYEKP